MGALKDAAAALGILTRAAGTTDTPPASVLPPTRSNPVDPLGLDAVYRAVSLIQTAAAQLTLDVWRGPAQIEPPAWVANPDPWADAPAFLTETVASLALRGNAFWRVIRPTDPAGPIIGLEVLDPSEVTIEVPTAGPSRYWWQGSAYSGRDIKHLAIMRQPGRTHPYGLGPIQACRATIAGAARIRNLGDQWLDQSHVPNGVISSDQPLTADQAAAAKDRFLSSVKATEPVVLGQGLAYKPLLLTPAEMQWIDSQQFNVTAVARMFGIPPRLMLAAVEGSSQTYANQSQEELSFVRWSVMGYLRPIESAITWLLPRGNTARFNLDAILRADTKTRYEAHAIALSNGWLSKDEVRAIEGLPPANPADLPAQGNPATDTTSEESNV